jgi:phenylacetate-CoA ligase
VAEYRVEVDVSRTMPVLRIELETMETGLLERVERTIRDELLVRPELVIVPPGTLPRFEMKSRRFTTKAQRTQRENQGDES